MTSFRDRNPYVVGAVSIAVIGVAVTIAFLIGLRNVGERAYTVTAQFSDAAGLKVDDDVRVAGVKAGRVARIRADRVHGRIVVDLRVRNDVELGRETTAEIALQTLLGRKYVRLGGPVEAPFLRDAAPSERVIPIDRTRTPFDLFELARVATRGIEATDTDKLNQLITDLADITENKHDQVTALLEGIARVSEAVNQRDDQLRRLLDQAAQLSATLEAKDDTLVGLIDQSEAVLALVSGRRADIGRGLERGGVAVEQLAALLRTTRGDLDTILTDLHGTLGVVDRRQADLDRALAYLSVGGYGLALAPSHGPWADIYVRNLGPDLVGLLDSLVPEAPA